MLDFILGMSHADLKDQIDQAFFLSWSVSALLNLILILHYFKSAVMQYVYYECVCSAIIKTSEVCSSMSHKFELSCTFATITY